MDFSNVKEWSALIGGHYRTIYKVVDSQGNVIWEKNDIYFYVEDASGSDNLLTIKKTNTSALDIEVFYSTDIANWNSMGIVNTTGITATIPANGKLYLKARAKSWDNITIKADGLHNIGGKIKSLLYSDSFDSNFVFPTDTTNNFKKLFDGDTNLLNANRLILNIDKLVDRCYYSMFNGCTSLATAPALPATTLASSCYSSMFNGCTSLTAAPALPATTLASSCYSSMFVNCASLTQAPELSATTLVSSCYSNMFRGCTSLTAAPALPATTLASSCYNRMLAGCTSLTTAPELPATTLVNNCYEYMFSGCTSLTTVPTLNFVVVSTESCMGMFNNCRNLTTVPPLKPSYLNTRTYQYMFFNCTSLNRIVTYITGTSLFSISNWVDGVSATGDFYNLGGYNFSTGASGIPTGWTEHTSL